MVLDACADGIAVDHRTASFDVDAVVEALDRRRHRNRDFVASVSTRGKFIESQ